MSLADQFEQDMRPKKARAKEANDRWVTETKSLKALQEKMASKRS
jgi:hypothetical protein